MRGFLFGEEEEEEERERERASAPRLLRGVEDGEGELEGSSLGVETREGEVDASTLGVRLRGLRRRVCVVGASKAKEERFRRPLKVGEETGSASRLTSSALRGRVLVSAMVRSLFSF